MSNRYFLFAGSRYYPSGGWYDFVGIYSTLEEAVKAAANHECDWWHVATTEGIVEQGDKWGT